MKHDRTQSDNRRGRWFAEPRLQCGLLAHTILYWLYCVSAVGALALVWIVFARHPQTPAEWIDELWLNCGPLAVGSLLILPLVLLDCIRFSRRFAGPMVRFRRALHDLANGDPADPIELREGDFWFDFARDLNQISQRLRENAQPTDVDEVSTRIVEPTCDTTEAKAEFGPPASESQSHPAPPAAAAISPTTIDLGHPANETPVVGNIYA